MIHRIPNTLCLNALLLTHAAGFVHRPQAKHASHVSMSLSPELLEMNKSTEHDENDWYHDGISAWAGWSPQPKKEVKKVQPLPVLKNDWIAASFEAEPVVGLVAPEDKVLPQQGKSGREWYSDGFGWLQYDSVNKENDRAAVPPPSVYHPQEDWYHDGISAWAKWSPPPEKEEKKDNPMVKYDWVAASFEDTETNLKTLLPQDESEHEWYSDGFGWLQNRDAVTVYHSRCFKNLHGVPRCSCKEREMVPEEAAR